MVLPQLHWNFLGANSLLVCHGRYYVFTNAVVLYQRYNMQLCAKWGICLVLHSFCDVSGEHYSLMCQQCDRLENHDNVNWEQQNAIVRI